MYMCYASTSKNGLREGFPLHWKVIPYFSNFIMKPLYSKCFLTRVSPVQRIIQILQVFYSLKPHLWMALTLVNAATAGVQELRELKLRPPDFAPCYQLPIKTGRVQGGHKLIKQTLSVYFICYATLYPPIQRKHPHLSQSFSHALQSK